MKKISTSIIRLVTRHPYVVSTLVFITVIGFLDANSLIVRYTHRKEIKTLQHEISIYQDKYDKDTRTIKNLDANPKTIEKIAREKYFMKRPNEDVFVFE